MPHHLIRSSRIPLLASLFLLSLPSLSPAQIVFDSKELSADIVRVISKDLFDLNSLPFMQPLVETFNAASNAGFYRSAFIPVKDTFYLRVGLRGMFGLVREDQRTYRPRIPTESTESEVVDNILALSIANGIKKIFRRGIEEDSILVPETSGTILGNTAADFHLNNDYLRREIRKDPLYQAAIEYGLDSTIIDHVLGGLPNVLALPSGADISTIVALVPQIDIGALYGTEVLLRFIPPIKLDTNVGRFSYWGIGLRHNVSRYFTDELDVALLAAYQRTSLRNAVGVTRADLQADGSTFKGTLHASKELGAFSFYGGICVQRTEIDITYIYTLPRQLQAELGLITPKDLNNDGRIDDDEYVPDPENGFPGDTKPQTSHIHVTDAGLTCTIGADHGIGPVHFFADLNLGKFNILSSGITINL